MKKEHARKLSQVFGALILVSTLLTWRFGASPRSLFHSTSGLNLIMVASMFLPWCLCLIGSIGLLLGRSYGFYCMVVAFVLSVVGSTFLFIPFVGGLFIHSPIGLYLFWTTNLLVVIVLGLLEYFARWRRVA
jgi:hypothetical protein